MAAVVQQVAERRRQQGRKHQVQVGEVAGQRAGGKQDAAARARLVRIGLKGQGAVGEFAQRQAYQGVSEIVHPTSLP